MADTKPPGKTPERPTDPVVLTHPKLGDIIVHRSAAKHLIAQAGWTEKKGGS